MQDLSHGQMPIGSPSEKNVAVSTSVSVTAVPMSVDENMPVLVHAYAPISPPGYPPPSAMSFHSSQYTPGYGGQIYHVSKTVM